MEQIWNIFGTFLKLFWTAIFPLFGNPSLRHRGSLVVTCLCMLQVMPEIKGSFFLTFDEEQFEGLNDEQRLMLVQAKEAQESCIRRFLGLELGSVCGTEKLYRIASWCWLQAMVLRLCKGFIAKAFAYRYSSTALYVTFVMSESLWGLAVLAAMPCIRLENTQFHVHGQYQMCKQSLLKIRLRCPNPPAWPCQPE